MCIQECSEANVYAYDTFDIFIGKDYLYHSDSCSVVSFQYDPEQSEVLGFTSK